MSQAGKAFNDMQSAFSSVAFFDKYCGFGKKELLNFEGCSGYAMDLLRENEDAISATQLCNRQHHVLILRNASADIESGLYTSWTLHKQDGQVVAKGSCDYPHIMLKKLQTFFDKLA